MIDMYIMNGPIDRHMMDIFYEWMDSKKDMD